MCAEHTSHLTFSRHGIILCSVEITRTAVSLSKAQGNYSDAATAYSLATTCMPLAGIYRIGSNGARHQECY
jgi:hypothetical protein